MFWYGPESMDCDGVAFTYGGRCWGGLEAPNGLLVGIPVGCERASCTSLVHELAHRRWDDPGHARPEIWGADPSTDGGLVPGARVGDQNLNLAAQGL